MNPEDIVYAPIQWGNPNDPDRRSFSDRTADEYLYWPNLAEELEPVLEQFLFELNNDRTRASVVEAVSNTVSKLEGVYDYRVVCDASNNGPKEIADHRLNVDLWLKPAHAAEFVYFHAWLG